MRRLTQLLLPALLLSPMPLLAHDVAPATIAAVPGPAPVSPPPETNARYFYVESGERRGPVSLDELRNLVTIGVVTAATRVWTSGLPDWIKADTMAQLADLFAPPPIEPTEPEPVEPTNVTAETIDIPGFVPNLTENERQKVAAVMGATLGILFHEFGHAIIGEIGVPATGPEEDAADEFSALLLGTALAPANFADEPAEVQSLILAMAQYSTLLWHFDAQANTVAGNVKPWYDEHSDSANRFRNTFCLLYGADPANQAALADWAQFPQSSRDRCAFDYPRRFKAWQTITAPYMRDMGDGLPANQPADAPGAGINVVFTPSETGTGQYLLPVFEKSGLFQELAKVMQTAFVWPRAFKLEFGDCGEANAYYDPQNVRIIMCWEGVEYFAGRVLDGQGIPRR